MGSKDPPNSPILRERPLAREGALGCFTLNGPPSAAQPGGFVRLPAWEPPENGGPRRAGTTLDRQPAERPCPAERALRQDQAARWSTHSPARSSSGRRLSGSA